MPDWRKTIHRALARRADLGFGPMAGYRVLDGEGDGAPDLWIDSFAGHWIAQGKSPAPPPGLIEAAAERCKSLWWKHLTQGDKTAPRFLTGLREERFLMEEHGVRYWIEPSAGYSPGIFLDQRENRRWIMDLARNCADRPLRVLNLFAYTCGFSAAAAAAGAATASVDLSARYLDWGRENFVANAIQLSDHQFLKGDTFSWLRRLAKRGECFDVAILDPPTFSRGEKGKVFRVEKDFGDLVAQSARLIDPAGGWLLCSTNSRSMTPDSFKKMSWEGAMAAGRVPESCQPLQMPPDFPGEDYLKANRLKIREKSQKSS